ncbi:uncharacterized protein MONOS_5178 [Monocercomonoides exilis]|uniref:uncharacterized protein n=1 Tax=Monocercomonoides exilis TaxID=2049356 RepID=UPI00355AABCF|nr:hypothetical protein MONOS_5178 [Monocercomonoides exilis]
MDLTAFFLFFLFLKSIKSNDNSRSPENIKFENIFYVNIQNLSNSLFRLQNELQIEKPDGKNAIGTTFLEHCSAGWNFCEKYEHNQKYCLFSMLNSTVLLDSISVRGSERPVVLLRDIQAECCFCNCLFWRNWDSDNFCDSFGGLLRLENISFLCSTPNVACGFVLSNSLALSSRIHLKRCTMHSFSVNSMNPFLSAENMESVAVDECHFENITHKPDAMRRKGLAEEREFVGNGIGMIEVESSSFFNVVDADCGCIFDGYHTFHHYLSFNCSFIASRAQANNTRQVNSSGNVVLRDSLFTVVSEVYEGGAVLITGNATLTIERTTFLNCKCAFLKNDFGGGAISATGTGFISIANSSFKNNSCVSLYGGAIRIYMKSAGDVSITDSTFIENEGPHFGAFEIIEQASTTIVDSCTFYRNKAKTYYGGSISFGRIFCNNSLLSNCSFKESSSAMYAGAIFISRNATIAYPTEIRFLFFDQNTCRNNKGTDIAIRSSNLTFYNANNFSTCFSTSLEKRIVFCTNEGEWDCITHEPKENWIPTNDPLLIHVDPSKEDNVACGNVGRECKTIGFAITRWLQPELQKVYVSRVNHLETSIAINGRNVKTSIEGSGDRPTITSKNLDGWLVTITTGSFTVTDFSIVVDTSVSLESSLFLVSNAEGKLNLVQCEIAADSTNRVLEHSQFSLLGGTVNLTLCEIRGFSLQGCGLFQKESASSLLFEGGSVCDIARSRGNGTIIGKTLGDGEILAISNITFRNCTSSAENGGAFGLCLDSGSQLRIGQMSQVAFEECSAPNSEKQGKGGALYLLFDQGANDFILKSISFSGCRAWKGKNVFVDGGNLSSLVKASSFAFNPQTEDELTDFDELSGYDAGDRSKVIPLVLYLRTFSSPAYVSGDESDADDTFCGYKDYPCRTVEGAAAFRFANSACELSLLPSFAFLKELTLASQSYVFGAASQGQATEVGSSSVKSREMLVSVSVPSTFANITFLLNHSIGNRASFISLQSATLSLTSCSIGKTSETESIEYTAVMASGGVLTVTSLSVAADQALSFSAPMLLLSGSVVCNLFGATLSSIATTGPQSFVEASSSGLTNITNCSFGGFSLAKRGMIHSENGGSLYVGGSSFADVSLLNGNGSCIDFAAGEDAFHYVTVFNCSFQGCSVLNNGQSGGGIFASLKSSCELLINSTSFLSCTAPSEMLSGFGGGISLFALQSDASFAIDAPSFSDELPNKAKCGNDIFVSSPDLASSVNRESFCFYDEQNPFSAASCVGIDEKGGNLMIPLVCYLRSFSDIIYISAEGSDVPVCGYVDFGCRTLGFSFTRLPGRKKAVTITSEYAVGESCVLSDANGYSISGLETKTRLKMEGNETQAMSVMEVRAAVFFSCFFIEMASSLHSTKSAVFYVADSNGVLEIENCECQPESGVSSISYCLFAAKTGKLVVNGFVMSNVQFSAGAAVVVNESGACEIMSMIFENVTSSANGEIMKYSSTGEMNVNKSHFSSSMESTSSIIFDEDGAVLCVSNTTFSEIGRSEGQGGAVEGVVGDGCRMVLEGVVFLNCCTEDGCGGGLGLSVSGTGHLEMGKEELNSVFKSCAAKKGNGNGGKGGGIFIRFSGEVFDYVICCTIFGAETEKNEAEEKGENIFIEGDDLSRIVTQQRFEVECDVSKEKHNEFVGFDRNADKHVPLASFLSNWTSPVFVNSEEGADYQSCGFSWYPCSSIVYAAENRFAGGVAAVCLEPNFSIADKLVLSAMPMIINGVSKPERVNIAADGRESGNGLVITQNEVAISWLEFCAPCEFLHVQRKSLILCAGSKLVVEGCSMVMQSGNPSYRFLLITSGSVKLTGFNLNSIEFKEAPAIELVGAQASGVFDRLHLESVNTTFESGGVIFVSSASAAHIENSTINLTSLLSQTAICVKGGASLTLKKSNFSEVNRTEGNGGAVVGEVDSEKRIEIKECNFAKVMCYHTGTKGGSMLISVAKRGTFLFEKNCVNESRVPGIDGLGGGLHLTFSDVDLTYSMKLDEFNNNDALLGKDVYLVCTLPRRMINPLLWSGSAKDGSEYEKTMWVLDPSDAEMNMSLLRFLFPSVDDIVFVDDGLGQVEAGCGSSVKPCKELSFGFTQLGTEKNILHITSLAKLEGEIKQNLSSLTIRGESVKSDMIVDGGGCICVSDGDLSTQLTMQNIRFAFATSAESPQDALIVGKVGSIFLISCDVSKSADAQISNIKQSILCGKGSTITLTSVIFSELAFEADQAICVMQSGSLIISGCTFASISTSKKSLIGGMEGTCIAINNTQISECSSEFGSVAHWENALEVEIVNTSSFANCSSEKDNGGAVNLIFSKNYRLTIADVSFSNNSADEEAKNGGAIFVQLSQDLDEAIEFSSLHFLGNKAHHGKDMFVACADLNRTVLQSRFQFPLVNEEGKLIVDLFGRDEAITNKEAVNLTLFLLKLQSSSIHVSAAGHDYLGCGSDEYPCNTFWRGYMNMDKTGSDQKLLTVDASTVVQNTYDVSSFSIIPGYGSARSTIVVKSDLELCTLDSIFLSAKSLSIQNMLLSIPTSFTPPVNNLLRLNPLSTLETQLAVKGCVFECSSGSCIDYILISSAKGRVELSDCTLPSFSSGVIPLDLSSSVLINGMNFTNIVSASSGEGGVARVELKEEESLSINGTKAEGCSCAGNGRGGAFFVKCSESLLPAPFVFGSEIILADNEAMIGKNVFVASSDLNRTVTKSTFAFLAEKAKTDCTLFCGSDAVHRDTDLLRFLCGYKDNAIFVSSNGFDIARCGSEDDPCESFWKGMVQIERSSQSKVITVDDSTFVRDAFIVSNYTIVSYSASPDEARKAVVEFQNKTINDGEPFLTNSVRLALERLRLRIAEHFDG